MSFPPIQPTKGLGDIANAVALQVIDISQVGAGTLTIFTPASGKTFLAYYLLLQNTSALANLIQIISNATIVGRIQLVAGAAWEFRNAGLPMFIGRATGDPLKITVTQDTIGLATVGYR